SGCGRDIGKWRIWRDVVPLHDFFHVAGVLVYVIAIIFGVCLFGVCLLPLRVFLVELILIIRREPSLPIARLSPIVVIAAVVSRGRRVTVLGSDLIVGRIGWNRVPVHQVLHVMFFAQHVIAITVLPVLRP